MLPERCARHSVVRRTRCLRGRAGYSLIVLAVLCRLLLPLPADAAQTIIVSVTVNLQPKGEYFVVMTDDGDFLISMKDLRGMGITDTPGKRSSSTGGILLAPVDAGLRRGIR